MRHAVYRNRNIMRRRSWGGRSCRISWWHERKRWNGQHFHRRRPVDGGIVSEHCRTNQLRSGKPGQSGIDAARRRELATRAAGDGYRSEAAELRPAAVSRVSKIGRALADFALISSGRDGPSARSSSDAGDRRRQAAGSGCRRPKAYALGAGWLLSLPRRTPMSMKSRPAPLAPFHAACSKGPCNALKMVASPTS